MMRRSISLSRPVWSQVAHDGVWTLLGFPCLVLGNALLARCSRPEPDRKSARSQWVRAHAPVTHSRLGTMLRAHPSIPAAADADSPDRQKGRAAW